MIKALLSKNEGLINTRRHYFRANYIIFCGCQVTFHGKAPKLRKQLLVVVTLTNYHQDSDESSRKYKIVRCMKLVDNVVQAEK